MAQIYGAPESDGFILNEATLMLGPLGSFKDLTVEEHSVGLFKQLAITNTRNFADLPVGVRQETVAQTLTSDMWEITGNGFEYNPRTLMYALGQEGYTQTLAAQVKTTVSAPAATATSEITVASATGLAVGDFIIVQPAIGDDNGLVYKILTLAAMVITLDRPLVSPLAVGDTVVKTKIIETNPTNCSGATYLSAKIVSAKSNCEPIVIWIPKVQVTSGLQLTFGASDYSSIPYTMRALTPTRTDAGYADFITHKRSKVIIAS